MGGQHGNGGDDLVGFTMGIIILAVALIVGFAFFQGQITTLLSRG